MKWWRRRRDREAETEETARAARELEAAQERLEQSRDVGAEVRRVARELRMIRRRNGFGDMMTGELGGHR